MLVIEGTLRVGGLNITDAGQTRARWVTWHICFKERGVNLEVEGVRL